MEIRETTLPVLRPVGGEEEVMQSENQSRVVGGAKVLRLLSLKEFAELVGAKYAVAVNSATSGQDLVLKALGIKDCDIINPTISFMTTAVVPLWNNCTSTIVDVRPHDLNICPETFVRISNQTLKQSLPSIMQVSLHRLMRFVSFMMVSSSKTVLIVAILLVLE